MNVKVSFFCLLAAGNCRDRKDDKVQTRSAAGQYTAGILNPDTDEGLNSFTKYLWFWVANNGLFVKSKLLRRTTPSRTHCAAGFLGSSDTPVSCSSSWFTTSILVSASMRFCRLWRLSSGVNWNEWTWAVVMFRMWTTWRDKRKAVSAESTNKEKCCFGLRTETCIVWALI